jgi:hypothetical protein
LNGIINLQIEGADKIEAARIKGWWVVVIKNQFNVDDKVVFYEVDSFLPIKPEYEFLLKGSKEKTILIDGEPHTGIRLKTTKQ